MTERRTPRRHDPTLHDLDRRGFVRLGVVAGVGTLAAACGWDGGRLLRPGLLDISRVNDWVGEQILFSPTRLAPTYTTAQRSAMLPSYFISTMTPMLDDPAAWRLRVDGSVAQPLELSLDDLMRLPRVSYTVKHHCVEGRRDRKSTRLNSSHLVISYAVFCLKKKKKHNVKASDD